MNVGQSDKEDTKSPRAVRILYIGPIPPEAGGPKAGGVASLCWGMASQAGKHGYEVYICANVGSSYHKDGVNIINMPSKTRWIRGAYALLSYITRKKVLKNLDFLSWRQKVEVLYKAHLLTGLVNSIKPDLIHVLRTLENAIFSLATVENCPPIMVTDHGIGLIYECNLHELYEVARKDLLLKRMQRLLEVVNCVISVSQFPRLLLLKALQLPSHPKLKVFLNPINTEKWPLIDREEAKTALGLGGKKVIFFCGVHWPIEIKGLGTLLETIAGDEDLRANCHLLIITSEEALGFARTFVNANKIQALLLKPQPQEKLVSCYNAADVFVMPSKIEGIATVYYEALLAGVPLVGFSKNVEELENVLGIYIGEKYDATIDTEKSLAEKIKKVLNTGFDRQLLRKKMIDKLSWEARFKELDSIYRESLNESLKTDSFKES